MYSLNFYCVLGSMVDIGDEWRMRNVDPDLMKLAVLGPGGRWALFAQGAGMIQGFSMKKEVYYDPRV